MTELKNIILLSIDALRADHVSYHGYERETTPFLDDLAKDNIACTKTFSASSHTRESIPSLLTGHHPCAFAKSGFRLTEKSVAEHLSGRGYATAAFHSNPYVSRAYDFDSGFDMFDDDLLLSTNKIFALLQRALDKFVLNKGEYHARASEINQKSLDWISSVDEPFFLWNHYMDVHGPYNPPEGYVSYAGRSLSNKESQSLYQKCVKEPEALTDEEKQLLIDLYDGEIRYLDEMLSEFVGSLDDVGILDNSLLIVTSDHGDAFGEHGYYAHPRHLHDELVHVPLILSFPEDKRQRIDSPVSTLDITPTVLEYVGGRDNSLPGTPLVDSTGDVSLASHPMFALSSAQGKDEHESIRRFAIRTEQWAYFISREIDSGEIVESWSNRMATNNPDVEASCPQETREILHEHSEQCLSGDRFTKKDDEANQEIEERLETLGYK